MKDINLNIDEEFWQDFIQEAAEHLEEIEMNVLTLEKEPENMDIINSMFRAYHTIKGLSGFVEHTVIQEIAHKTETLMDYCRRGEAKVTKDIVNAILKSSDYIKQLTDDMDAWRNEAFIEQINVQLDKLDEHAHNIEAALSGGTPASGPAETPAEMPETTAETVSNEVQPTAQEEPPQPPTEQMPPEAESLLNEGGASEGAKALVEQFFATSSAQSSETTEEMPQDSQSIEEHQEIYNENMEHTEENMENMENSEIKPDANAFLNEDLSDIVKEEEQEELLSHEEAPPQHVEEPPRAQEETPQVAAYVPPTVEPTVVFEPPKPSAPVNVTNVTKAQELSKGKGANEEFMRVSNSRIDYLVDTIGELLISQSLINDHVASHYTHDGELTKNLDALSRVTRELQDISTFLRSVSLKSTFQKITRIARDTIEELGKDIEFVTNGESTEIDRIVADRLLEPLVHLIKNAISHGVEVNPDDRENSGKRRKALVELNAYNKRGKIYMEIKDDGRGINTKVVYGKALEKGIIDPNREYSDDEIKEFIMLPGFSTAEKVDNISGRGVGMDVVKTQILKIGGKVSIKSEMNIGSTFTLEVPVNHAVMSGIIVDINSQHFILPTANVKEIIRPREEQWIDSNGKKKMVNIRNVIIPAIPPELFGDTASESQDLPLIVVLEMDGELRALPIHSIVSRQEVVVKPVSEELANLKFLSGMSILGNGRVSLILDVSYMFQLNNNHTSSLRGNNVRV
ncbi:two-component system, chemotaxis family, sensor kinase CheA [Candidatus Gastranaerophilus sp. (ex Termes propinquus)]|nr:two-component system, chemotaxis family, sensor kinase CheA [Candidatus Gastranaerophilus sp. (ex Termes propinquus)]